MIYHDDIQIIKQIGQGKYAVYLAYSANTKENFALKMFSLENGKIDALYKNEVRFAHLDHPNIVKTVRLCTNNGRWNHVMQYCSQGELFSLEGEHSFTQY